MTKIIILVTSLMFSGLVLAQETYMVNLNIHSNSELLASPSLMVENNKQVSVSVRELYDISFKIQVREDETIYVPFNLNINGKDHSPSLIVRIDTEASIEVGEMKLSVLISKTNT
ncbi:MAG: hypothetical protein L3J24_14655 [Xanthomonadales bacterium]|nr:hypothetical protein [Xanthomonadales bacterium]